MSTRYITANVEPEQLTYTLNAITLTDSAKIVGSAKYAEHVYPSDVDVFEMAISNGNREFALDEFSQGLSNIGRILKIDSSITFTEFKAGQDPLFNFEAYQKMSIPEKGRHFVSLLDQKILTADEALNLYELQENMEKFQEAYEEHAKVRWSLKELIDGEKMLPGNRRLTLRQAISMNAVVKLDTVTWFASRPQSVEVFYLIGYVEAGEVKTFYQMGNYIQELIKDINFYKTQNPLKTMKRLWSLSRVIECEALIQQLIPVFGSDAAALNQIKADIETLKKLKTPVEKMLVATLEFNKRLRIHLTPEEFAPFLEIKCDALCQVWHIYKETGELNLVKYHTYLDSVDAYITPLINKKAEPFYEQIKNQGVILACPISGLKL